MTTEHTAGPWHVEKFDDGTFWIMDKDGNYLFEVVGQDDAGKIVNRKQLRPNMNLAAAAPDMSEALELAVAVLGDMSRDESDCDFWNKGGDGYDAYESAKQALAKAEGKDA